ncbi:hypothetical protein RFM26_30465 [Mesorhizobium sp. VK23B]|uniref:Amidohydrolase family protein n=1 Tax=Mesorhizobium dulcispinae TaxID=3072316 RepID=A0ABU4XNF9_9HYPH|nr:MULTISPECIES: hypothetical protein [unclassified Mesorhizobium]MDX8470004.1 hypothetical protein [Mesorhizobium sp. VK23B]MDX8476291.1 hypothetical protein [Mesorhizobium sp. VK23A]
MPADDLILANARMLDGNGFAGASESWLRIADGVIAEISDKPISSEAARTIDLKGHTLMPGLIDCHVHGGFKRSSQHLNEGGCDGHWKATITPFWTGTVAVTGTSASGEAI